MTDLNAYFRKKTKPSPVKYYLKVKRFFIIFIVAFFPYFCSGQVLISLLLGRQIKFW